MTKTVTDKRRVDGNILVLAQGEDPATLPVMRILDEGTTPYGVPQVSMDLQLYVGLHHLSPALRDKIREELKPCPE